MHALKMAVFDFDGTLVDSVPAIARGIQLANEEIGIAPVSYETAKSIIGLGFKDIIPIVAPDLPESEYGRYKDIYVRYFLQSDPSLKLFPGVLELLRELQDAGIKTAIATGKSRKGLSRIVNRMNVWDYFDDSITADEALPKPDPLMLNTLLERKSASSEGETQLFIETPYRNSGMLADLVKNCAPTTLILAATDISGPEERIRTFSAADWKKQDLSLPKLPTVFGILGAKRARRA